jgi:hypothetical protein
LSLRRYSSTAARTPRSHSLSGKGADLTEKGRITFARYKGEAENALLVAGFHAVYIFRPAYITPRAEPNFGYRLLRAIYPVFRMVFPNQVIRADDLARAMVDVAVQPTKERRALVFENNDLLAIVEWNRHLTGESFVALHSTRLNKNRPRSYSYHSHCACGSLARTTEIHSLKSKTVRVSGLD